MSYIKINPFKQFVYVVKILNSYFFCGLYVYVYNIYLLNLH